MTIVERNEVFPGFQWAEPLQRRSGLDVKVVGDALQITGCLPKYGEANTPSDLLNQYQIARKNRNIGKQSTAKDSPHISFANADTDEKLVAFVRSFGPVAAQSIRVGFEPPITMVAMQDMKELRNERSIYRAALALVTSVEAPGFDFAEAQRLIQEIGTYISDWPRQWKRECSAQTKAHFGQTKEPLWKLSDDSLERIKQLGSGPPGAWLPPNLDARIVICELVNAFRPVLYPNPVEMNTSIRFGVRPLLYAILRREVLHSHETGICANTRCRDFFEVERSDQQFCTPECSRQQRQRDYWNSSGKKLRIKRLKKRSKQARGA